MSVIDICNRALLAIGARSSIQSLTEISNEARACNMLYDSERKELLEVANWSFAKRIVNLTLYATSPLVSGAAASANGIISWPFQPYAFEYIYPPDCRKFRRLRVPYSGTATPGTAVSVGLLLPSPGPFDPPIMWEKQADVDANGNSFTTIVTNLQYAVGEYTMDEQNPDRFDGLFTNALEGRLAASLAMPLAGNLALAKGVIAAGKEAEAEARMKDANEANTRQGSCPDWLRARGVDYGDWDLYGQGGYGGYDGGWGLS